jgi:hypothetical protein
LNVHVVLEYINFAHSSRIVTLVSVGRAVSMVKACLSLSILGILGACLTCTGIIFRFDSRGPFREEQDLPAALDDP